MSVIVKPGERLSYSQKLSRLAERLRDPEWRRYGRLLLTGKLMGVGLVLLFMVSHHRLVLYARVRAERYSRREGRRYREPDQHRLDAGRGVPGVRHAGRLHDARSRLLPLARDGQRADGMHRRHLPLRPSVLRLRLRVHVQPRQRLHRLSLVLPARRAGNL